MDSTPQEIEVWYIIPAIRKEISAILKEKGLKQKDIAVLLGVTEAAISQYFKSKRAQSVTFSPEIKEVVKTSALKILETPSSMHSEIQQILAYIKNTKRLCDTHKQFDKVPCDCDICIRR